LYAYNAMRALKCIKRSAFGKTIFFRLVKHYLCLIADHRANSAASALPSSFARLNNSAFPGQYCVAI